MADVFRVREGFAIPGPDGFPRTYAAGALIGGDDPVAKSHAAYLDAAASRVEKATAAPEERRRLRLPSGVTLQQATRARTGHAHRTGETSMVNRVPPEDPASPASTFASVQPGAGVVADDVPPEQNPAGGPKASEVSPEYVEKLTPEEPPGSEDAEAEEASADSDASKAKAPAKKAAAKK